MRWKINATSAYFDFDRQPLIASRAEKIGSFN